MKKLITGAFILALTIGAAQAQSTQGNQQGHRKEQRMAYSQLNLSAEQQASVKKINEEFKKQMVDLNKQDQLTVAEMRKRRQTLQDQHHSQIEAILTPAQKEQFAKIKAERGTMNKDGKGRFHRGEQGFGSRAAKGAQLEKELNLTADQKQKVEKLRSEFRTKMQALRSNSSITQDEKREKMKDLVKQQQEEMKSVLTKEQIEKMKSLRQEQKAARNTK